MSIKKKIRRFRQGPKTGHYDIPNLYSNPNLNIHKYSRLKFFSIFFILGLLLFPIFLNLHQSIILSTSKKNVVAKQVKQKNSSAVLGIQNLDLSTALAGTAVSFVGTNLLRNSSFEQDGSGSKPSYWNYQLDSTTGNTFTSAEGIHSGSYGLKFVGGTGAGNGLDLGISQPDAKTVPGRTYTLSAWIKIVNVSSVAIRIGFWDEQNNRYADMKTFNYQGIFDWKRISMTTTTAGLITDSKNYFPIIEVRGLKDGSVYMDDVQLEEGNALTAYNSASAYTSSVIPGNGSILAGVGGNLYPATTGVGQLGTSTNEWNSLYLSGASIDSSGNINSNGNLNVSGTATASGLMVNGNATLGKSSSNLITANGQFNSSLIPSATNAYDLGSSSLQWNNLYAKTLNISGGQSIGGNFNVTGTFGVAGASTFGSNITQTAGINSLTLSSSPSAFNVNSGLFNIDTQNSRIGIGTTTPGQTMEVNGTVKSSGFILGTLNGIMKAASGVFGLATGGTDYENPLTFNYPLTRSSNTISLNYNATNLYLASNTLNTIQDIATTSFPTFAGLNISGNLLSTGQGKFNTLSTTGDATVSGTLNAATGRTRTIVIAASNSTALEKAQADYVCTGVSALSAALSGTVLTSPSSISPGTTAPTHINVSGSGTVTVVLPAGQTGLAISGTSLVTGNPQTLSAGSNTITVTGAGYFFIQGMADEVTIQAVINSLSNGGTIHFDAGIYNLANYVTLPNALPFFLEGSGMPTWFPGKWTGAGAGTTPTDGTQIRGYDGFNYVGGGNHALITRLGSALVGSLSVTNMAIMPAYGTGLSAAYGQIGESPVYGLIDYYSSEIYEDKLMFMPWGWAEASYPLNHLNANYAEQGAEILASPTGRGSSIHIGSLYIFATPIATSLQGVDNISIDSLHLVDVDQGVQMGAVWNSYIRDLETYLIYGYAVQFGTTNSINKIDNVENEQLVSPHYSYIISLSGASVRLALKNFLNFPVTYTYKITSITNSDNNVYGDTLAWNLANSGIYQTIPISKIYSTSFGNTITNPFISASIGSGGNLANPVSATTYTANEPVDVTISGGTVSAILTKDAAGNTIDNNVTTLTHRLLLPNYTIEVTYTVAPTTTVVYAAIGNTGTTAMPQASVNYVAMNNLFISLSSSTNSGVLITTYDGSSNTEGNVMDSNLTSTTRYPLQSGQIINLGAFTSASGTISVVSQ